MLSSGYLQLYFKSWVGLILFLATLLYCMYTFIDIEKYTTIGRYHLLEISTENNVAINGTYTPEVPRDIIPAYMYISEQNKRLLAEMEYKIRWSNESAIKEATKLQLFSLLSEVVQIQLHRLQNKPNCSETNIICGHRFLECGLGCQIHHRGACLILSYALGVPLIHDEDFGWPYKDKWKSVFLPLGSTCEKGPHTYKVEWNSPYPVISRKNQLDLGSNASSSKETVNEIECPLKNGIPVFKDIANLVEIIHPFPYMWWIGQFMKFTLRLNKSMKMKIHEAKQELHFRNPIVGFHVRRTDKLKELKDTYHPIKDYVIIADQYFHNHSNISNTQEKNIFIASDDARIVNTTSEMYAPKGWNIIGFKSRRTYSSQVERGEGLFEMIIDLFLLLETDFVVCGYSSNVCTLILEVFNHMHMDGMNRVKSLDGHYQYWLTGFVMPQSVVKIDANATLIVYKTHTMQYRKQNKRNKALKTS